MGLSTGRPSRPLGNTCVPRGGVAGRAVAARPSVPVHSRSRGVWRGQGMGYYDPGPSRIIQPTEHWATVPVFVRRHSALVSPNGTVQNRVHDGPLPESHGRSDCRLSNHAWESRSSSRNSGDGRCGRVRHRRTGRRERRRRVRRRARPRESASRRWPSRDCRRASPRPSTAAGFRGVAR